MNIKEKFLKTEKILKKYQFLWEREPIEYFPILPEIIKDAIPELKGRSIEQLIDFENLKTIELDNTPLLNELYSDIKENLISFKEITKEKKIKTNEIQGLTAKKVHEIQRLIPFMSKIKFKQLIDIGSGKAHLSFLLAKEMEINCKCIDANKEIQEAAKRDRFNDVIREKIQFRNQLIKKDTKIDLKESDLLFGLHACGDLSIYLMQQAIDQGSHFLSIPCCFHKQTIQNLSGEQSIILQQFALNLANRSKVHMNDELYEIRREFKRYRYALEFIYQNEFIEPLPALGNAHKSWYKLSFKEYVQKYDHDLFGLNDLEIKYEEILPIVEDYILIEVIRNPLARLIEQYLILDRALFLEQNEFLVDIHEIFDSKRSPRNIAIYASKEL